MRVFLVAVGNNYDLALDFKFCRVRIANKKMSCSFTASLKQMAQVNLYEGYQCTVKTPYAYLLLVRFCGTPTQPCGRHGV